MWFALTNYKLCMHKCCILFKIFINPQKFVNGQKWASVTRQPVSFIEERYRLIENVNYVPFNADK